MWGFAFKATRPLFNFVKVVPNPARPNSYKKKVVQQINLRREKMEAKRVQKDLKRQKQFEKIGEEDPLIAQ
jgi:hypothetical protein